MISYTLMLQTNYAVIQGKVIPKEQIDAMVDQFLSDACTPSQTKSLYPLFYLPPSADGKKLKTLLNQTPKTNILAANMYELEILRLLHLFAPENPDVIRMVAATLNRLKTTCFGFMDDGVGECFDTSLIVLRFLATVAPNEVEWIHSRIENYRRHRDEKKRPWFSVWYYWLCLSELPFTIARPEIEMYKQEILNLVTHKSFSMNRESDQQIHPVLFCILRNLLSKYPEYAYLKERQPYIGKDGRLHFDMQP